MMKQFHVRVIGGSCGNKMILVADHIREWLAMQGYACKVTSQSVWESFSMPPAVDLILQLLPAYTQDESDCPVLYIKPLLTDLDHPETLEKILALVSGNFPKQVQPCVQ